MPPVAMAMRGAVRNIRKRRKMSAIGTKRTNSIASAFVRHWSNSEQRTSTSVGLTSIANGSVKPLEAAMLSV
jgi:hypothetical protein